MAVDDFTKQFHFLLSPSHIKWNRYILAGHIGSKIKSPVKMILAISSVLIAIVQVIHKPAIV